jgi:thiamine-monophosphate kinase
MAEELDFIARLRSIARDPAARGLADDAAVWQNLVLTHDMIAEGVHYLPDDHPHDVAWKLLAVNLSDLAAKGAKPVGVLMGYSLGDAAWDAAFADGLSTALNAFDVALLGGDTVRMPQGSPRALGLTAIGVAPASGAPDRRAMRAGDDLWVSGVIGDAGLGLAMRLADVTPVDAGVVAAYVRPVPRLALGQRLAAHVSAMMDVSDGLLLDLRRMAEASGCCVKLSLDLVPLSAPYRALRGDGVDAVLAAARAGDDYELLWSAPPSAAGAVRAAAARCGVAVTHIGTAHDRALGDDLLTLEFQGQPIDVPISLGFTH